MMLGNRDRMPRARDDRGSGKATMNSDAIGADGASAKPPMQTFLDAVPIVREKTIAARFRRIRSTNHSLMPNVRASISYYTLII